MPRILLSIILILAPVCQVRGQFLLTPIVTGSAAASDPTPVLIVKSCQGLGANGGTTSAIDTTGANFIVITKNTYNVSPAGVPSDNKSNGSPTALTAYVATTQGSVTIYYWTNPTVGSGHTFTDTSSASYLTLCIEAWSNMATSSVFDSGTDAGTNGSGSASCAAGAITPSAGGNRVIIASAVSQANGTSTLSGGGLTKDAGVDFSSGNQFGGYIGSFVQSAGAAITGTWSGGGTLSGCGIAAFKGQ